jgi:hypothetical protein
MSDLRRAGDETRTRDIFLGKEVLYQLSYTRVLPIEGKNDASEAYGIKKYLSGADGCQCQCRFQLKKPQKESFATNILASTKVGWSITLPRGQAFARRTDSAHLAAEVRVGTTSFP